MLAIEDGDVPRRDEGAIRGWIHGAVGLQDLADVEAAPIEFFAHGRHLWLKDEELPADDRGDQREEVESLVPGGEAGEQ